MKSIHLFVIYAIACAWYTAAPGAFAQDVVTLPAVEKRIVVKVSAPAHVQAVSNAVLSAPTAGIVTGLRVTPGETVRAGQTIARLTGPSVMSEKARLAADLRTARIRVSAATQAAAIEQQKFDDQLSTRDAVARVRAELDAARQQLVAAQSTAQGYTGLATIAVSEPGVVTTVSAADGQYVSAGQPLVTVSSSRDLHVVANLYGSDAALVAVGMKGAFLSERGDAPIYVVVKRTSWSVATPGQLEVWLSPVEGSSLEPGSVGTISLSAPDEKHLAVPSTALVLDGGEWWVLVHDKAGNHRRHVAPGLAYGGWTSIRGGLSSGELVVTQDAYLFFHQDFSTRYQQAD
ncbi:efflux RND transporter periplasmic adaptor subunit [Paraburkholderia kirstenboschensis]|uniref:Efflux RND transporter periplasmic adaptor subunit n=1 Tax=Paraburkholderia kirstenboschensis TaxID=1245436 RepID=A0ABZ0ECL6_9BURK|nr:efflux RND transporter periplasmic adaptor subunit [Paraburkholderia kirstenboschensis]WOD14214.1 efflux RND transporter periplasmic adaptor subunit [Paraburkholderia kirstenboschensis]